MMKYPNVPTTPRHALNDDEWKRLSPLLPPRRGRPGRDDRLFLNAVLWIMKTGCPWRDLPSIFGSWAAVYQRFSRWCNQGHFSVLVEALKTPDLRAVQMDSTSCKAHQASSGGRGTSSIGVSRGGRNTKIHTLVDAAGLPVRFVLGPGQEADINRADEWLEGIEAQCLIADKGYDANDLVQKAEAKGMTVVIPSRRHRRILRPLDQMLYKMRHRVENFFQRLKVSRRIASRYDKLDIMFLGWIHLASSIILLKHLL